MARRAGFEPATTRLTAGCSAVELPTNTNLYNALGWIRTSDPLVRTKPLCPLSYKRVNWLRCKDSNLDSQGQNLMSYHLDDIASRAERESNPRHSG